jgi:hypothetical protein
LQQSKEKQLEKKLFFLKITPRPIAPVIFLCARNYEFGLDLGGFANASRQTTKTI